MPSSLKWAKVIALQNNCLSLLIFNIQALDEFIKHYKSNKIQILLEFLTIQSRISIRGICRLTFKINLNGSKLQGYPHILRAIRDI